MPNFKQVGGSLLMAAGFAITVICAMLLFYGIASHTDYEPINCPAGKVHTAWQSDSSTCP